MASYDVLPGHLQDGHSLRELKSGCTLKGCGSNCTVTNIADPRERGIYQSILHTRVKVQLGLHSDIASVSNMEMVADTHH